MNKHSAMNTTNPSRDSGTQAQRYGEQQTSPYGAPDNSWISISGTVVDVARDQFELDYGDGVVTVEMDDGDRDADAYSLLTGDKVRVMGRVDDDLFETTTIDAMSVQVDKLGTTFYADPNDQEALSVAVTVPITVSETVVNGRVISVDQDDFMIDTGMAHLTVDVSDLASNPLDDRGFLRIDVGDRVSVTGDMTREFFEGRQLDADVIVELSNRR
ncbi:hypothetical protein HFP89_01460 [Wenzhouxiangella sp. XN79A]|uniref:hypothetical protein n=1 Tax=Wenzhouxiangella sp. XN79A TaxID=2724193 RepID=UPI00144AA1DF|nr:hypothetical protein [Wenzhouxiangella sp. XN79A]NKI33830.1 hypothetical protein [Wenzhouxiangella sp. XN79A]